MQETQARSLGREDPLEEGMVTHPVFLPHESHGQRSLMGYSPQGHRESDTTEATEQAQAKSFYLPSPQFPHLQKDRQLSPPAMLLPPPVLKKRTCSLASPSE